MEPSPRKVLFVATVFRHLAAFHVPMIQRLIESGYEVHAAASSSMNGRDAVASCGTICHEIPFSRAILRRANLVAYRKLGSLMRRERFDLVHVHTPIAAWLGRLAAHRSAQQVVLYTAHGFHFHRGSPLLGWLAYYPAERLASRWTDGLIVMNEEDLSRGRRMGFRKDEDLFLVHGVGVDLDRYRPVQRVREDMRRDMGIRDGEFVVACIAEMNHNKNHALLLDAWTTFARCARTPFRLLLIGDGPLRASLEKRVLSERIPHVHLLGFREDVPALLQATDAVVLTSHREGLPRSIMEAMAAGKPVVATGVRGTRDLVKHEVTGLLVRDGDAPGLADALALLLADTARASGMGRRAMQEIIPYSTERVLGEMEAIYRHVWPGYGTG